MGVIFYQMLYGKKPFGDGVTQQAILRDRTMLRATSVDFPATPKLATPQRTLPEVPGALVAGAADGGRARAAPTSRCPRAPRPDGVELEGRDRARDQPSKSLGFFFRVASMALVSNLKIESLVTRSPKLDARLVVAESPYGRSEGHGWIKGGSSRGGAARGPRSTSPPTRPCPRGRRCPARCPRATGSC